jgi:hypothetical protein
MNETIAISPEIARLAQRKTSETGASFYSEIARIIVEEAVMNLDPELGLMVEPDSAAAANDIVAGCLGVNDLVVNGKRVDVRAMDADGRVAIDADLIGTSYLSGGTIVVRLRDSRTGEFAGFISPVQWADADTVRESDKAYRPVGVGAPDLSQILANVPPATSKPTSAAPDSSELLKFLTDRSGLTQARRKEIAEWILSDSAVQTKLEQVAKLSSTGTLSRMLSASSAWNVRVEKLATKLAPKFKRLTKEQLKEIVAKTGEKFGGQPEAPAFRQALIKTAMREELIRRLKGADLAKLGEVADKVLSGKTVSQAVGDFVKNKVAVEIAGTIKRQRSRVADFASATADEIGFAFQQMALQPAYATHSQDSDAGVDAINEALMLLEAAELADELKDLEQ